MVWWSILVEGSVKVSGGGGRGGWETNKCKNLVSNRIKHGANHGEHGNDHCSD